MFELEPIKKDIEIKGFNNIYYFEFGKNFIHEPEQHNFWEMVYVDRGNVISLINGVGCVLSQGQVTFHEPMELHAHISDNKTPNNMMIVSFSTDSEAMNFFKGKTFTLDKSSKTLLSLFLEETKNALGKIPNDYGNIDKLSFKNAPFGASQLLEYYLTEFLIRLIRTKDSSKGPIMSVRKSGEIGSNSLCELICEYMKNNVYNKLTLKDLCQSFFIGKTQLCKIFNEYVAKSPMEYFSEQKIITAKKLLREDKMSISEISDMLNFSTIHAFSRKFKNSVGVSPTSYKKSIL